MAAHWTEQYIGQPYIAEVNDCAALAIRVQAEVFARDISDLIERESGLRAQSAQIDALKAAYAQPVTQPVEGDAVLMRARGVLNHIGIYTEIERVPHVLHAMRNAGQVCLHRLRDLAGYGLHIEGYYRWMA